MITLPEGEALHAVLEIKRSKFIGCALRCNNEEEAREFIHSQKALYPDARHHCSAYRFTPLGLNTIERSSDDGEPSGTAGRPMLDTLNGTGLDNVCVVVTRYFGGVLLGTGGLVRAYSDTVTATFDNSPRVRIVTQGIYGLDFDYATAPRAEAGLRAAGWNVTEVVWDAFARVHVAIDETRLKELAAVASQLSGHTCKPIFLEYRTVDVPLA